MHHKIHSLIDDICFCIKIDIIPEPLMELTPMCLKLGDKVSGRWIRFRSR